MLSERLHIGRISLPRAGIKLQPFPLIFLLSFLFATAGQAQLSGTYTICGKGCDYASISDAASDLDNYGVSGPVTFSIDAGSYDENVTLGYISGADKTNTITFEGKGNSTYVYTSTGYEVFYIYGEYFILKDMKIEQPNAYGGSCGIYYSGTYTTIQNCTILAPQSWNWGDCPIYNSGGSYLTVDRNIIRGGYNCIYMDQYGAGYNKIINNRITQPMYTCIEAYDGYYNTYTGNTLDSVASGYGTGLYSSYEMGCTFSNNIVNGNGMDAMANIYNQNVYTTSTPWTITNNIFNGQPKGNWSGLVIDAWSGSNGSLNVIIAHNTINLAGSNGSCLRKYAWGFGGFKIQNNIFSRTGSGQLAQYESPGKNDRYEGNDYYNTGGTKVYYNGTSYSTVADYMKAAQPNGHGFYEQNLPVYYVSSTDLHLDKNKGAPFGKFMGITTDIDGDTRCNAFPTSGADESTYGKGKKKPSITGNTTVYENVPTVFYNSIKADEPFIFKWYINGVYQTDSIHMETTKLQGPTASIKLVAEGCAGKDSSTITVTVVKPTKAPVSDFLSDKNTVLMGSDIRFTDLSTNGASAWKWEIKPDSTYDFGLKVPTVKFLYGSLNTHKWVGKFHYPGKYEICLTASNSIGQGNKECKSAYIDVIPSVNMGGTTTITDAQGYLYDEGGPNGPYINWANDSKVTIDPCADSIYLVFKSFDLYCGGTYMRIYEGDEHTGRELHPCKNNKSWAGPGLTGRMGGSASSCTYFCAPKLTDTFKSKGKMTIIFDNDYGNNNDGFEAYWWSKPKNQAKPVAKFNSVDTICTNGVISFTNESTGDEVKYQWDLDGDPSFYEANSRNTTWPYFFPGQYTVTLIASNCGGMDTFTKTIVVLDPPKPKADFKADNTNPTINDVVYFETQISECVDEYRWTFTKPNGKDSVVYANGSSAKSRAPQITFPDTGCYTVKLEVSNVTGSDAITKTCYINVKSPYCIPTVSTVIPDIGISSVTLEELHNTSRQGVNGYENFTPTHSAYLEIGVTYTVTVARSSNSNKANRTVWIDWNADGDFDDAQEKVGEELNSSALSWDLDFTVPTIASTGATKMRIAINHSNFSNKPCGQNEYGEYEDYRLYISSDLTPPVITMKGKDTVRVEQGYAYVDSGATAKDNLDGVITNNIVMTSSPTFNALIPNTYVFSYNVDDKAGNHARTKKRVVIITPDKTPPALRVAKPDTVYVEVGQPFSLPKVLSADDLVDGSRLSYVSTNNPVNPSVVDTYTVSYYVEDETANDTTVERVVIVQDLIAPTLRMTGADTVYHEIHTPYTDAGVTYNDNYYSQADLDKNLVASNNVDVDNFGTYLVNYSLTDPSGNMAPAISRVVIVQDMTAPVLTLNGDDTLRLEVNSRYKEEGITITDNHYTITKWDTAGTFFTTFPDGRAITLGTYTVIYEVKDGSGNAASITRVIKVVDDKAPVITLNNDIFVNVCRWEKYVDAGYSLSDNYYSNAEIAITPEGSFLKDTTDRPGTYGLRFKATDKSGNVAYSEWRNITVKAENDPFCVSGINDGDALAAGIRIYPNPNSGKFTISAELPANDRVRISIMNTLGQEVAVISNGALGSNTFSVDLSDQANGMYFIKVTNANYSITKQVVISK